MFNKHNPQKAPAPQPKEKEQEKGNTFTMFFKLKQGLAILEETLECQEILAEIYAANIEKKPEVYSDLEKKTELRLKLIQKKAHIKTLKDIITQKKNHFNLFLPKHEAQMKECAEHWDYIYGRMKEYCADEKNSGTIKANAFREYHEKNSENDLDVRCGYYQVFKPFIDELDKQSKNNLKALK